MGWLVAYRALALAGLLLLLGAPAAEAHSMWVLWQKEYTNNGYRSSTQWEPLEVDDARATCERRMEAMLRGPRPGEGIFVNDQSRHYSVAREQGRDSTDLSVPARHGRPAAPLTGGAAVNSRQADEDGYTRS